LLPMLGREKRLQRDKVGTSVFHIVYYLYNSKG